MPSFTYTGDEGRYYPTLGLTPEPGQAYELDGDPGDGRWTPVDTATPTSKAKTTVKEG